MGVHAMVDDDVNEGEDYIPANPELARMAADGVDVASVIALTGYVGASPAPGVIRLHPGLEDLSVSVDIRASDILATKDAPAATMPMGGVIVWVSRTTDMTFRRTRTVSVTAQQVRGVFGAGPALGPASTGQVLDRLNIRLRPNLADKVPPVYECGTCQSTNCASHCIPPPPPCQSHPV